MEQERIVGPPPFSRYNAPPGRFWGSAWDMVRPRKIVRWRPTINSGGVAMPGCAVSRFSLVQEVLAWSISVS